MECIDDKEIPFFHRGIKDGEVGTIEIQNDNIKEGSIDKIKG